jgi:hypothetical protein
MGVKSGSTLNKKVKNNRDNRGMLIQKPSERTKTLQTSIPQ